MVPKIYTYQSSLAKTFMLDDICHSNILCHSFRPRIYIMVTQSNFKSRNVTCTHTKNESKFLPATMINLAT